MSGVISTFLETNFDLTLGTLNVRIDSITKNVQISTTGVTIDILYDIKLCDTTHNTVSQSSSSATGISTTPTSLDGSVVNDVNKYIEIQLIDVTLLSTYIIRVTCIDDITPLYLIAIFKTN